MQTLSERNVFFILFKTVHVCLHLHIFFKIELFKMMIIILAYTMCPNVLSHGTQDKALPLDQLKCLETWLNCIVTCIQSRINYFSVTFNLTKWQRFILHPVLEIYYHRIDDICTLFYETQVYNPELIQCNAIIRH